MLSNTFSLGVFEMTVMLENVANQSEAGSKSDGIFLDSMYFYKIPKTTG